jgi:hypothetical protein
MWLSFDSPSREHASLNTASVGSLTRQQKNRVRVEVMAWEPTVAWRLAS